ncbi:MAG: trigger factor [Deltaproteobacteria bacterium]
MRFDVENISAVKKKISVEVPAERVVSEIEAAYGRLKNQVKMDGFRKGKIPRTVLERYYHGQVNYEVLSKLINESYKRVLSEHGIVPVSDPEIDAQPIAAGTPFKYSVTVEVQPEMEITGYEGLKIEKERVSILDSMVNEKIEELRKRHATLEDVERPLGSGDTGLIDFEGVIDGTPFKGGKAQDMLIKIGSGRLIPGFEEQLVGMSAGEEKDINVRFPEDYNHKEFAGKDATFRVKLKEVKLEILPSVDDEFAKDLNFSTLDELKAEVRKGMEKEAAIVARNKMRVQAVNALIEKNPLDVPRAMLEKHKESLLGDLKKKYTGAGIDFDAEAEKNSGIMDNIEKTALAQIKGVQILMTIARKEGIKVGDNELEERLRTMAEEFNADVAAMKGYYEKNKLMDTLRREILEDKVYDFIISKANVVEVEGAKL